VHAVSRADAGWQIAEPASALGRGGAFIKTEAPGARRLAGGLASRGELADAPALPLQAAQEAVMAEGKRGGTGQAAPHGLREALTKIGVFTARPTAFLIVGAYVAAWAVVEPSTLDWHGVATVATWMMTLFIQRAEHRDTQAIQTKLDELLKAVGQADASLKEIDQAEPEEIEAARAER
jgi:low affinity Fe/Cu permease